MDKNNDCAQFNFGNLAYSNVSFSLLMYVLHTGNDFKKNIPAVILQLSKTWTTNITYC